MCDMVGIIVSVVLAGITLVFSYWLIVRKKRPCEILFLAIDCINVYNKLSQDFDGLEIKTNGEKINNDLLFFSGAFVCNGYKDIKGEGNQLSIKLPAECKWKNIKISSLSKELKATIGIDQEDASKAFLSFGQFRMKEFITIKGLIECKDRNILKSLRAFHKKIDFFHRIEDTEKVNTDVIIERQEKLWLHILLQLPFVTTILGTLFLFNIVSSTTPISYKCPQSDILFRAQVSENGNILLRDRSSFFNFMNHNEKEISPKKFKENYEVVTKYEKYDGDDILTIVIWGFMDIFIGLFLYFYNRKYFRNRKRMRMYIGEK